MARIGRPPLWKQETAAKICVEIADGTPATKACVFCGVSADTFSRWMRSRPPFAAQVESAKELFARKRSAWRGDLMASIAIHASSAFVVPRRGESPDARYWPKATEPLQNEMAELAAAHCRAFPVESTEEFRALLGFGLALLTLLKRRAEEDIDDGMRPSATQLDAALVNRIVAARLGRILDWTCKGRHVLDMGLRAFAACAHVRASALTTAPTGRPPTSWATRPALW